MLVTDVKTSSGVFPGCPFSLGVAISISSSMRAAWDSIALILIHLEILELGVEFVGSMLTEGTV